MVKRFAVSLLASILLLTGCSGKLSTEAESSVKKVSKIYGEENPKIIEVHITQEKTTKKRMYIVSLEGSFKNGESPIMVITRWSGLYLS